MLPPKQRRAWIEALKRKADAGRNSKAGEHAQPERGAPSSSNRDQAAVYIKKGVGNQPAMPIQRDASQGHRTFGVGGTPLVGLAMVARPVVKRESRRLK